MTPKWLLPEPEVKKGCPSLLLFTSCHAHQILHYLDHYRRDIRARFNVTAILIHVATNEPAASRDPRFVQAFQEADFVVYHPLRREKFGEFSTDALLAHCKPTCVKIGIPSPSISCFWPITEYFGLEPVLALKRAGLTAEQVISCFENRSGFDPMFWPRWSQGVGRILLKEQSCDVKIADFVIRNQQRTKLWLTFNHPTYRLIAYMVEQCLARMDGEARDEDFVLQLPMNAYGFTHNFPETQYEWDYFGFTYPMTIRKDRGGPEWYRQLIRGCFI